MHCKFCDVPKFGFYGNASIEDMDRQIRTIIEGETDRFNVHFARMGEPTWNDNVLAFGLALRGVVKSAGLIAKTVHPARCFRKQIISLETSCRFGVAYEFYNGEAGLQFSINSTDDEQRNELFDSKSLSLARLADELPMPVGRKYTLNFPVTSQTILDSKLFDREKFIVKITPIHETASAIENGFQVTGYSDYRRFEQPLLKEGWDVIVFV